MTKTINVPKFLEYYSLRTIRIAVPVIICLILDAFLTRFLEDRHGSVSLDRSFKETMSYSSQGLSTTWSIYLALIIVGSILVVTTILLALYYYGCVKIIFGWMILAVTLLFSYYIYVCFGDIPKILNLPVDWISVAFVMFNLVVVGNLSIFWRAPKVVTQFFMIFISTLIALVFLPLPDWTVWALLILLAVYDACVVLCPHGLLNMLIKKSEERGDAIPALIYSSAVWIHENQEEEEIDPEHEPEHENTNSFDDSESDHNTAEEVNSPSDKEKSDEGNESSIPDEPKVIHSLDETGPSPPSEADIQEPTKETPSRKKKAKKGKKKEKQEEDEDEEDGIKLGLGDFCFYGILITRAARLGWDLVILCVFAVMLGLSLILLVLTWLQRPLPALPFSLILGIIFFMIGAVTFRKFDINIRNSLLAF